jgi:Tfp pilus assembly protein PilF
MRVLFSTGSPARYMRPPSLGDEQVNCGPDWPDERAADGRIRSLATPAGDYDLATVAAQLPPEQQPDVVVCLVDASWRNVPHNLAAFKVPRVLLVADTHHLRSPLIGMLRYLAGEPFDRVVFLYDRHHAAFFHAAGFRNLHWFPGLTFPHGDAVVRAARQGDRTPRLAFVGQAGNFHPRRTRLLAALAARGLPLAQRALPQDEAPAFYGSSLLGFNASLNGDLNLRIFEIMAAGAGLLTDRLAPGAGLDRLFTEERELATYGCEEELVERAAALVARPAEAESLGGAGARWFDRHLGETVRRAAFRALAFDGVSPAPFEFDAEEKTRVLFGGDTDRLLQSLMVYEGVQELHRTQENVRVSLDAAAPDDVAAIFATLPRVEVDRTGEGPADLAVFGRGQVDGVLPPRAARLWCRDAEENDFAALAQSLAPAGLLPASRDVAVFCRAEPKPAATAPVDGAAQALMQLRQGNSAAALELARAALAKDPRSFTAHLVLGELALERSGAPLAEKLFRRALELKPHDAGAAVLLADALRAQGKTVVAGETLARALKIQPDFIPAFLALARLRTAESQPAAAEAALREAVRRHPRAPEPALALGDLLKRAGRLTEALEWHRRALGTPGSVDESLRPARRRIVFVVQHGPFWPSLASVHAAFAADPDWETVVVAMPYLHPYYTTEAERNGVFGFLEKEAIPHVRWDRFGLAPGCADVMFLQNPYDVTRPAGWRTEELLRLVPRLAYVPYCFETGGGEANLTHQFNLPLQRLAWAVFARNAAHKAMFAAHCATGDAHVSVTGHPKTDALRGLDTIRDTGLASFAAGRRLVCWNPHFDVRPDATDFGGGYSTFLRWWRFLPEEFARRPDLALVIRPHPLLFATLEQRGVFAAGQIEEFRRNCAAAGNILIDARPSYLPVFAAAAAMLSDLSSFVLEFAVTGKPLLYLKNPHGPGVIDRGVFAGDFCPGAITEGEVTRFLDQVAAGEDLRAAERRAAYGAMFCQPEGGVGAAIKRVVDGRLAAEESVAAPPEACAAS